MKQKNIKKPIAFLLVIRLQMSYFLLFSFSHVYLLNLQLTVMTDTVGRERKHFKN